MKTVKEANSWWDKLEAERALYVWGMNGDVISDFTVKQAYAAYKSSTYDWEYYNGKLSAGAGKIGADCSGAFKPLAESDNTAAGYYAGCIKKGGIATLPVDTPCMVFKRNAAGNIYHIGWYRPENKTVSEMASSQINFRRQSLNNAGWILWGIPKFIKYNQAAPEKKTGWIQENNGWRFYLGDSGSYVANDWYKDGDKWYWFNAAGIMVSNTWYQYKDNWYYLGSDGAMLKGQMLKSTGKWYYLDPDGKMATKPITLTPDKDGALQFPDLAR